MYLRFQIDRTNQKSGQATGIFTLAHQLIDTDQLNESDVRAIRSLFHWFQTYLPMPTEARMDKKGISWFKKDKEDMISKAHELKSILDHAGHAVNVIETHSPGEIVYQDDYQI